MFLVVAQRCGTTDTYLVTHCLFLAELLEHLDELPDDERSEITAITAGLLALLAEALTGAPPRSRRACREPPLPSWPTARYPWAVVYPQTVRRRLWRLNGVLGVTVLVVWGQALLGGASHVQVPTLEPAVPPTAHEPVTPTVEWNELVALCRAFHGWGPDHAPAAKPSDMPMPTDGRLPLAAFKLLCWIQDDGGPDSILLKSKDPAHPETFLPMEGTPDRGVSIERIERRGVWAFITVRREDETFTYRMIDRSATALASRHVAVSPRRVSNGAGARPRGAGTGSEDIRLDADVKLLPFYGKDGRVAGARVTGVRPGSRLACRGLRPGDLIVGIDGEEFSSVDDVRRRLSIEDSAAALDLRRGSEGETERISLGT